MFDPMRPKKFTRMSHAEIVEQLIEAEMKRTMRWIVVTELITLFLVVAVIIGCWFEIPRFLMVK